MRLTGRLSVAVVAAVVVASTPTSFAVVIAILWFGILGRVKLQHRDVLVQKP
jgi:hypothetical protein